MPTVNLWHVGTFLGQLAALPPAEYARVSAIAPGDKAAYRREFATHLVPLLRRLRPHGRAKLKDSLRYFLNTRPGAVAEMIAAMQDVPMSSDEPFPLLEALWEVLFPGQDFRLIDRRGYVENNDDAIGNEIFAPDGGWADPY